MTDFLPPKRCPESMSEISGSFYEHNVATKLPRREPSQVPWTPLLTAPRGERHTEITFRGH